MSEKVGRLKGLAHDLTVLEKGTSKIVQSNMLNVTVVVSYLVCEIAQVVICQNSYLCVT